MISYVFFLMEIFLVYLPILEAEGRCIPLSFEVIIQRN